MIKMMNTTGFIPLFLGLLISTVTASSPVTFSFEDDDLLGTSCEIKLVSDSRVNARKAYESGLAEIVRLAKIFNTYTDSSEISQLNRQAGHWQTVSPELYEVMQMVQQAQLLSHGSFSSSSSLLSSRWRQAVAEGREPASEELQSLCQRLAEADAFQLSSTNEGRLALVPESSPGYNFDAVSKGYIIDAVLSAVLKEEGVSCALVNIGGDLRSGGDLVEFEGVIRHPFAKNPLSSVKLKGRALATSGNYERFYRIGEQKYSHIINARTGRPVNESASVSVISTTAAQADMLATVLSLVKHDEALAIVDKIPGSECLIVESSGQTFQSNGWADDVVEKNFLKASKSKKSAVSITFEQKNSTPGKKFKKHYTNIWVENSAGEKVKDVVIWYDSGERKYLKKMKAWYKNGGRFIYRDKSFLKSVSEATRKAGRYTVEWDGTDNYGEKLPAGKYTVNIEVNREKGPGKEKPTVVIVEIDTTQDSFSISGKDQPELGGVLVERR